jgi:hypothetical protein
MGRKRQKEGLEDGKSFTQRHLLLFDEMTGFSRNMT